MNLFKRLTGSQPVKDIAIRGLSSIAALSPTGELITLDRDKAGRFKAQTAGGWAPEYGASRVRELHPSDSGRAYAYEACVWAFRCINARASKVADLMHSAQLIDKDTEKPIVDHPFLDAIAWAYEEYLQDVYFDYMASALIFGETYIEKVSRSVEFGRVRYPVGPGGLRVLPSVAIEPIEYMGRISGYELTDDAGAQVTFGLDEIAYNKLYKPSSTMRGLPPMNLALEAVNVDMYIIRYSKQFYANGARPGLVFSPKELDLTESDMDNIREEIKTQVRGVDNFFRPMFINYAMDATLYPAQTLEDQGYLTSEQRERIASAFSVPEPLITFKELTPQIREGFYEETIIPDVNHAVRFFNVHVMPFFGEGIELKANVANITALLPLLDRKADVANKMFDRGAITHNERRMLLSMTPDDDGDFYSFPAGRTYIYRDDLEMVRNTMLMPSVLPANNPGAPPQQQGGERDRMDGAQDRNAPDNDNIPSAKASMPDQEGYALLYLSADDQLLDLQKDLVGQAMMNDVTLELVPRHQFHITLVHAERASHSKLLEIGHTAPQMESMMIEGSELAWFGDDASRQALVLRVSSPGALELFQRRVYELFDASMGLSPYSDPSDWNPHVTLAYGKPFPVEFHGHVYFEANQFSLSKDNYIDVFTSGGMKAPQDDMLDELRAWEKKARNKGAEKALDFVCYHLSDALAGAVVNGLKSGEMEVFDMVRSMVEAEKALQATRLMFEVDFEQLLLVAREEGMNRRDFGGRLRMLIQKYGEMAYRDGLEQGGVVILEAEPLPSDDRKRIKMLVQQSSQFVTDLGATLFRGDGISDAQANVRPTQWWGNTIMPFFDAGRVSAGDDPMMEFVGNDGAESCTDCQRLKGQVHRLSDWVEKHYAPPYGERLDCSGGGLCQHYLTRTNGPERGNW